MGEGIYGFTLLPREITLLPRNNALRGVNLGVIARSVFCDEAIQKEADFLDCFVAKNAPRNDTNCPVAMVAFLTITPRLRSRSQGIVAWKQSETVNPLSHALFAMGEGQG